MSDLRSVSRVVVHHPATPILMGLAAVAAFALEPTSLSGVGALFGVVAIAIGVHNGVRYGSGPP